MSTRRQWLDHRVTDRFFSRDELERNCQSLFPGYRFDILGGPRGIGLVWDAPSSTAPGNPTSATGMPSADVQRPTRWAGSGEDPSSPAAPA